MSRFAHAARTAAEAVSRWDVWQLDMWTVAVLVWIVWFFAWETAALMTGNGEEFTQHLRPLFIEHPLTWFLAVGLWLWLGVHLLAPTLEAWIIRSVAVR